MSKRDQEATFEVKTPQRSEQKLFAKENEDHFLLKAYGRHMHHRYMEWEVDQNHPLAGLLNQLPRQFFFSGEFVNEESNNIRLILKHVDPTGQALVIDAGTLISPQVDLLMEHAKCSSFGLGSESVYDESVRRGKELTAEQLEFGEAVSSRGQRVGIHSLIEENVFPALSKDFLRKDVEVKFYKLALYEPGGHFQVHRDTVHDPDHKATLLIEVYNKHLGGNLVLEKDDKRVNWDLSWDPASYDEESKKAAREIFLRWCLFYTDVEHQVETVTAGIRMVLQFDVLIHPNKTGKADEIKKEDSKYGYNFFGFKDIFSDIKPAIKDNELLLPQKEIFQEIHEVLANIISEKHAIAIPLIIFIRQRLLHLRN